MAMSCQSKRICLSYCKIEGSVLILPISLVNWKVYVPAALRVYVYRGSSPLAYVVSVTRRSVLNNLFVRTYQYYGINKQVMKTSLLQREKSEV